MTYPADYDWSDPCNDPACHYCNPKLPAIILDVYIGCQNYPANDFGYWPYVQIWERTGTRLDFNRLVYTAYFP